MLCAELSGKRIPRCPCDVQLSWHRPSGFGQGDSSEATGPSLPCSHLRPVEPRRERIGSRKWAEAMGLRSFRPGLLLCTYALSMPSQGSFFKKIMDLSTFVSLHWFFPRAHAEARARPGRSLGSPHPVI